ncbi:MAG: hypothetical protein QOE86_3222 [Solirubrobacteraceae bacterium]|nr:hypothetical protein [Solirubrobacteraceae bacterium]
MLLIETRDPEPDHQGDWAWIRTALAWLFPWPAIIAFLAVGSVVLNALPGMLFSFALLVVVAWRVSRVYPEWGGLSDHRQ